MKRIIQKKQCYTEKIIDKNTFSDIDKNPKELYTVHAEVIQDAITTQINDIETKLVEQGHTLINKEKIRLQDCLESRYELLDSIMDILNAGVGIIKFYPTPDSYYSPT